MKKNLINTCSILLLATLLVTGCKKENSTVPASSKESISLLDANQNILNQFGFSPWHIRSSGVSAGQGIVDMSEPDQFTCYGLVISGDFFPTNDVTTTHDGGATWHSQTVAELENNYIYGIAANTPGTVHVIGYDYVNGGGNVFRSTNGGATWKREASNAFTDAAASFPDAIEFFNPLNGVIFGDPDNGSFEIYTTHNGGNSWSRVPSNKIPAPLANEYGTVYFADTYRHTMWIVTNSVDDNFNIVGARLLESDDQGENWYVRNSSLNVTGYDGTIKFRNRSVGLYKNNAILYRTTDGGTTWNAVNYSGTWFSFDHDNIPGLPGWWISTGGGPAGTTNSVYGSGSSVSYDDGDHWITLDTLNHTCVDMTSPVHGYSGGFATSSNDGVYVYSLLSSRLSSFATAANVTPGNRRVNIHNPSANIFQSGGKFAVLRRLKHR